ncbi:methyltransferase domain-containing protein [Candidatus Saccharibacteria bacterium]|nr:methyltransferase domain-containing protein [Candidatus Saccharibacteria bacterium]
MVVSRRFFTQYIRNIRTIGAVAPSSRFLAQKMVQPIDFSAAKLIVQFGPGTGSFTDVLLHERHKNTSLVLIEFNTTFYETLVRQYGHEKNVYVYHGTAEDVDGILRQFGLAAKVDYIVSGLPFASLPIKQSQAILQRAQAVLKPEGKFITFQYTLLKKGFLAAYFDEITVSREWRNIPPAYVLTCRMLE